MVRANGIDLFDVVVECHGLVDYELEEVLGRRLARQELELSPNGARPRNYDTEGDLQQGLN